MRTLSIAVIVAMMMLCTQAMNPGYTYAEPIGTAMYIHASSAYCPRRHIEDWVCDTCFQQPWFETIKVAYDRKTHTSGYIGVYRESGHVVMGFRGTEDKSVKNWVTNLKFLRRKWKFNRGAKVHRGFDKAQRRLWSQLEPEWNKLVRDGTAKHLSCTGHSLGGALAALTCTAVSQISPQWTDKINLVTFGSPRVGNKNFARLSNKLGMNYRVIRGADLVTRVPPTIFGYIHAGQEIYYDTDFTFRSCQPGHDGSNKCSFRKDTPNVKDHSDYFNAGEGVCDAGNDFPWFTNPAPYDLRRTWRVPNQRNVGVEPINDRLHAKIGKFIGKHAKKIGGKIGKHAKKIGGKIGKGVKKIFGRRRRRSRRRSRRSKKKGGFLKKTACRLTFWKKKC